jgi:hypothetical protein
MYNAHHYNGHYDHWYSDQPEEAHNDVHTTSSSPLIGVITLKELGTIEVTTGERKKINQQIICGKWNNQETQPPPLQYSL